MASKAKLGSGTRFKTLEDKIVSEGKSKSVAKKIAATAGREKYGSKKMSKLAERGKKKK